MTPEQFEELVDAMLADQRASLDADTWPEERHASRESMSEKRRRVLDAYEAALKSGVFGWTDLGAV